MKIFKFSLKVIISTVIFSLDPVATTTTDAELIRDFKAVLMYFSEPFLKGAVLDGVRLEGEVAGFMPQKLVYAIENLIKQDPDMPDLQELVIIKNQLEAGIQLNRDLTTLLLNSTTDGSKVKGVQHQLVEAVHAHNGIIMQVTWLGHAIAMVIKPGTSGDIFDLTVMNTGDGINYHYNRADPNNIYPFLSLPWIQFSGIPSQLLFSPSAWFINGLLAIRTDNFLTNLRNGAQKIDSNLFPNFPDYFYGSFLTNFKDYLVDVMDSKQRFIPMQRSGSCALSSMMAALLFESKDETTFYFYRLKLGSVLVRDFLTKIEGNTYFKDLITDGFDINGRNFFKGLASSLAQQTLQYLEFALPDHFKHAGLIGSERSKWLYEKKGEALTALRASNLVFEAVRGSLNLCKEIIQILDNNIIRKSTNIIKILESDNEELTKYEYIPDFQAPNSTLDTLENGFYNFLDGKPTRIGTPINDFEGFRTEFIATAKEKTSSQYFVKIMDVFKRAHQGNRNWWNIFDSVPVENIMELQLICKSVTEIFRSSKSTQITSFDDICMLAHLQKLAWLLAQAFDRQVSTENRIGLEMFSPPKTLQSVLFGSIDEKLNALAGNVQNWIIHNIFDIQNYQMLKELLEEVQDESKLESFMGPEAFSSPLAKVFDPKLPFSNTQNVNVYLKMMESPIVQKIYDYLITSEEESHKWHEMKEQDAKFFIVFSKFNQGLADQFPHYYTLMDTLSNLRLGAIKRATKAVFNEYWIKPNSPGSVLMGVELNQDMLINRLPETYLNILKQKLILTPIPYSHTRSTSCFFEARHSLALTETIDIISIETWLNYIEDSTSAKVFDYGYFQYLTDHLLNVPKYDKKGNLMFPVNEITAKRIIEEFTRLIGLTLASLTTNDLGMTDEKQKIIINRTVNVSVILARFITRIDYLHILSGNACARALANAYNTIIPFAKLKPNFGIGSTEISKLNFALCHICSVPIRNSLTFMQSLELDNAILSTKKYRKTLERYHWFAARRKYIIPRGFGSSVADDQYIYGIIGSPLTKFETEFLQELLKIYFLPSVVENPDKLDVFKYHSNGLIVEIHSSEIENLNVMLNIWTGAVVKSGFCLVQSSRIFNSDQFQEFFDTNDMKLAMRGTTLNVSGRSVYALPNFKGSSYFMLLDGYDVDIYRKWDGHWYFWDSSMRGSDGDNRYCSCANRAWTSQLRLFSRFESSNIKRTIGFLGDSTEPIYRTVQTQVPDELRIVISGFVEDDGWLLFDRYYRDKKGKRDNSKFKTLQKHLDNFAQYDYLLLKDEATDKFVLMFPLYRLPEDPHRPLVIKEIETSSEATEFEVLNVPGMKVSTNQAIGAVSLPGGLVVVSESKTWLLIPLNSIDPKEKTPQYYSASKEEIFLQKIPIIKGDLSPQSRLHKLLLAYYMIMANNYKPARELLHPRSSIAHNDPFSSAELKVLKWIGTIGSDALEVLTFKVFSAIHERLNQTKFPLSYGSYISPCLNVFNYMFVIRELPEKYYIYRVFPEILDQSFYYKFMSSITSGIDRITHERKFSYPSYDEENYAKISPTPMESYAPGTVVNEEIFMSLLIGSKNPETMEIMTRLMPKSINSCKFSNNFSMITYCYVKEPELWEEFNTKFELISKIPKFEKISRSDELIKIIKKNMDNVCIPKYKHYFEIIDHTKKMTSTSLDVMNETMKSDLKYEMNHDYLVEDKESIELVTVDDFKEFNCLMDKLRKLNEKNHESTETFLNNLTPSKVLQSLKLSILNYIEENGSGNISQVILNVDILQDLEQFKALLEGRVENFEGAQAAALAELAALTTLEVHSTVLSSIMGQMHQRKSKTFSNLYNCYMRNSLLCIQKKFPELTLDQCHFVKYKSVEFFGRKILIDYFEMLNRLIVNFLNSGNEQRSVSVDDLNILCDELNKINDFNRRLKDPVIMNFEFRSEKYRLKPEQVNDIELLTTKDANNLFLSVVIQRMMAAGKTLVLGTISVVEKAMDNTKLSILVPPASLYQSNTTAMQTHTYQYFKKAGNNFFFQRFSIPKTIETKVLPEYLGYIIDLITNTMSNGNYLILSPDSLCSFINSYVELLLKKEAVEKYPQVVSYYAKIYRAFKEHGSIILDEIDMTMDPKKELNFPTEENEPYNMIAVTLLTDIVEFMLFDESIINSGLRIHSNDQASLTAENFSKCLNLVFDYIERELRTPGSLWYKYIIEATDRNANIEKLMKFLRNPNMSAETDLVLFYHNSGNETFADSLILVKYQLHRFLEYSLKGTVNLNYGSAGILRPNIKYAVPFVAANTPSTSSVFADRWETLLKTLLMISASPCNHNVTVDIIDYVRNAMANESTGEVKLHLIPTYQNLRLILPQNLDPLSLDKTDSDHISILQEALALRTPAAIRILFDYYINQVFNKMTFPTEQISCNALNLTSMFSSVQGYSGTIDNVNILPQTVIKEAFIDHEENEKNNGGIALKLIKDSMNGRVKELSAAFFTKSVTEMVQELLNSYPSENISAIIDTGAFFKSFKNSQVAKAILSICKPRIDAVLYYDEDSNKLEFMSLNAHGYLDTTDPEDITRITQVDLSNRFTFYDQRHITGSDILQPKAAHAIMTTGSRVLLRDILQGTLRMRQFMTSQKVHLVTTAASREFYCSKINQNKTELLVSDLLTLGALNEDDKQEYENEKLAFSKIDADIHAFILDEVSRCFEKDGSECGNILKLLWNSKSLFLRSIREVPLHLLQEITYQDAGKTLETFTTARLATIENTLTGINEEDTSESIKSIVHRFNILKEKIKNMTSVERKGETDSLLFYMKDKIKTPLALESGTEIQNQTLNLSLVELRLETLVNIYKTDGYPVDHKYELIDELLKTSSNPTLAEKENERGENEMYISLDQLYHHEKIDPKELPYLRNTLLTAGKRSGVTLDLVSFYKPSTKTINPYPIFSEYTFEGSHLLVQKISNNLKILLVSSKHASKVLNDLLTIEKESQFWLCDLSGSVTVTTDNKTQIGDNVLDFVPQARQMIFDLLIFNGSLTQILAHPSLAHIYKTIWLQSKHFRERAIFLRLRMNFLLKKDSETMEADDNNLKVLRKMSMGQKNSSTESTVNGYPKAPITDYYEKDKKSKFANVETRCNLKFEPKPSLEFDIANELRSFFIISDKNESSPSFDLPESTENLHENRDFDPSEDEIRKQAPREVIHLVGFNNDSALHEKAQDEQEQQNKSSEIKKS